HHKTETKALRRSSHAQQPDNVAALRHKIPSHSNFASTSTKTSKQKIRYVAACDQQHRAHSDKQSYESRPQIARCICVGADQHRCPGAIRRFGMLLAITLLESRHRRLRLLHRNAALQSADATHKTEAE